MSVSFRDRSSAAFMGVQGDAEKEIRRLALLVERNAKTSMRGGGSPHVPSRPGEPPHVNTGRLRASITHEIESNRRDIIARVGTNVEYAAELEVGSVNIAPRPFLRPALRKALATPRTGVVTRIV